MNKIVKKVVAGILLGFMVTAVGTTIAMYVLLDMHSVKSILQELLSSNIPTKLATLGTLPNALVFHLLIKNRQFYIARGVLMAVIVLAIVFAVLKIM